MKPFLIRHLEGAPSNRFPVWMMRQAGRYLPSYRAVRKQHTFWEMVTLPEVTLDVTLQPTQQLDVDAAILFSDILTLPYGLGLPVEMREGVGPVVTQPLQSAQDFQVFQSFDPIRHTGFVMEALRLIRRELDKEKALLGFCGAPWTVGCYLVQGEPDRDFDRIQRWMFRDPGSLAQALGYLAQASTEYLKSQVNAGADLVQIFDTWLCLVPRWFFVEYYSPILKQQIADVKAAGGRVAFYTKNASHLLDLLPGLGMQLLSIDSLMPLGAVDAHLGGAVSLQGNLSPQVLLTDESTVLKESRALWEEARGLTKPAVLNLGHGILPGTPVENVKVFLKQARELWH